MTIAEITRKMICCSRGDLHDINHFMKVYAYAKTIGECEHLDTNTQTILEIAAIVHDIACPLCREKYGTADGKLQEQEGPDLAIEFLQDCGLSEDQVNRIAYLVGHHHTLQNVDGLDYQILLEADYIVNADENNYTKDNIEKHGEKSLSDRNWKTDSHGYVPAMSANTGNIIFLDIDGVICTTLSTRISMILRLPLERQIFDPLALFWLRWLVRRSGAKIVLCSSWRDALEADDPLCRAFIRNLYERLAQNGTPIIDAAPRLSNGDKGEDILAWLSKNSCIQYVILDDHDCFALGPQVRKNWVPIPVDKGLRYREAKAALRVLQNNL